MIQGVGYDLELVGEVWGWGYVKIVLDQTGNYLFLCLRDLVVPHCHLYFERVHVARVWAHGAVYLAWHQILRLEVHVVSVISPADPALGHRKQHQIFPKGQPPGIFILFDLTLDHAFPFDQTSICQSTCPETELTDPPCFLNGNQRTVGWILQHLHDHHQVAFPFTMGKVRKVWYYELWLCLWLRNDVRSSRLSIMRKLWRTWKTRSSFHFLGRMNWCWQGRVCCWVSLCSLI